MLVEPGTWLPVELNQSMQWAKTLLFILSTFLILVLFLSSVLLPHLKVGFKSSRINLKHLEESLILIFRFTPIALH